MLPCPIARQLLDRKRGRRAGYPRLAVPGQVPRTGRVQCDNAERAQIERIIPRDMSVLNFDTAAHRKGIGQLVGNGRIDVDCLQ